MPASNQSPRNHKMTPYELLGLVKGLSSPNMKPTANHLKLQILVNILLEYVNLPEINQEVWKSGIDSLSENLKTTIKQ